MRGDPEDDALAVVIVAYRSAEVLAATLTELGKQLRPGDEIVVVDNASDDDSVRVARGALPAVRVVASPKNVGFAAGCHLGVRVTSAPVIVLLNPDAQPEPGCLDELRAAACDEPSWGAWQAVIMLPDGRVNSAGNVIHFLGFGWAGRFRDSASSVPEHPYMAPFPSGAAMAVRRAAWDASGGFDGRYFMYGEDLDLGLRLRLQGWEIGVVPSARVVHDYEFHKGAYKWFFLERNRWWTIACAYPTPLLVLLAPALIAFELALLPAALEGKWLGPKMRAIATVVGEWSDIKERRREVQARAVVGPSAFADALTSSLDSPVLAAARRLPGIQKALDLYWALVRRLLRSCTSD